MDDDRIESNSIEAPEDDDFGDFEGPEDEAPEAVQALVSGPNWVFPDLVRVRSNSEFQENNNNGAVSGPSLSHHLEPNSRNIPASSMLRHSALTFHPAHPRVLDPPDVSMLSSTAALPQAPSYQQLSASTNSTVDLCTSVPSYFTVSTGAGSSSSVPSKLSASQPSACSSPSQSSSSQNSSNCNSTSSSTATNLSGLNLSISSNNSSSNCNHPKNGVSFVDFSNPLPSTSGTSSANGANSSTNQRLLALENEVRSLEMHKALLQQQLLQKDIHIAELERNRTVNNGNDGLPNFDQRFEERLFQRLDDSLDRLQGRLETSMSGLEQRIELVENRLRLSFISGGCQVGSDNNNGHSSAVLNGECPDDNITAQHGPNHSQSTCCQSAELLQTLVEMHREQNQNNRSQTLTAMAGILQSTMETVAKLAAEPSMPTKQQQQPSHSTKFNNNGQLN